MTETKKKKKMHRFGDIGKNLIEIIDYNVQMGIRQYEEQLVSDG